MLASIGPVVSEENMLEYVDNNNILTYLEAYLYYQITYEPKGLGELKTIFFFFFFLLRVVHLTSVTQFDKKLYPSVYSMFHALCYHRI